ERRRFGWRGSVRRGEAKAANENGEPEIRGLAKLAVEKRKKSGAVKHDRQNFAALELSQTKEAEVNSEDRAPGEIRDSKNRAELVHGAGTNDDDEKKRSEHDEDSEKNRTTARDADGNDERESATEKQPVAIGAAR